MYKTISEFAIAMSILLFEMRIESQAQYGDDDNPVPEAFANEILDNPEHIVLIKKRIHDSVLDYVTKYPHLNYGNVPNTFSYNGNTYDHAFAVDAYIDEQWRSTLTKMVYVCDTCGSDNVQSKAWVRPNKGNEFVDLMSEETQDNYCDDCDENSGTTCVEKNIDAKVIGFQVVRFDGVGHTCFHPHMASDKSVYNLDQAKSMMDDDNLGDEEWELLAIWTADIEGAVTMFEGDLR